jgi:hypothetical protein
VDVAFAIPEESEWFPGASRRYPVQRFACVRASYQADGAGVVSVWRLLPGRLPRHGRRIGGRDAEVHQSVAGISLRFSGPDQGLVFFYQCRRRIHDMGYSYYRAYHGIFSDFCVSL